MGGWRALEKVVPFLLLLYKMKKEGTWEGIKKKKSRELD